MIKNTLTALLALLCLMSTLSLSQEQRPVDKPPLLTFDDLQRNDSIDGPFRIEGFVIQTYKCPPCPRGAMCKPCIGDHIEITGDVDEKDPSKVNRLWIFTDKPEQFGLKKKYSFVVNVRGKIPSGRAIAEVELISFDESNAPEQQSNEINSANWQQHPKIKIVRGIVESVNAALSKGSFKTSQRKFEYCEPYEDTLRKMAVDAKGVVRRYETQGGSDDSALTMQYYYDEAGRLRFVFISGGAINGSKLEHRIYFDESGKRIWEEHKYLKGPGYTFPEVWPDEQLQVSEPAKAFAATSPCPAVKSKSKQKRHASH